jgi:PhnB protein
MRLNPYLSFRDNAREAMEFYQSVFGGELTLTTFSELDASDDPSEGDKIMHGMLESEDDLVLMGADTPSSMEYLEPAGVALSLSGVDETKLRGHWDALSADGIITMPLERAPWGDSFGMCIDKFGTSWMVNITSSDQ